MRCWFRENARISVYKPEEFGNYDETIVVPRLNTTLAIRDGADIGAGSVPTKDLPPEKVGNESG
jgi:hypothetical protein